MSGKAHWRHVRAPGDHPDAFPCPVHQRTCRRVWVRATAADARRLRLLELDREQIADRPAARPAPRADRPATGTGDLPIPHPTRWRRWRARWAAWRKRL